MTIRAREAVVAEFLRKALLGDALAVPRLEAMARRAGLLGERQRITQAKLFRRAKDALGIRSVREGFGAGGRWAWELPRSSKGNAPSSSQIGPQPPRAEQRVQADWVEGVAHLQYHRPPSDVPPHRWRQFVDDCNAFLNSPQAERAAQLGWRTIELFGCKPIYPLSYLGEAGLLWHVHGGRIVQVNRDWAVVEYPVNRSPRTFSRRDINQEKTALPWTLPLVKTG
jgi:hypothetical protein